MEKVQIKFVIFIVAEILGSTYTGVLFFSEWEIVELEKQEARINMEIKEKELNEKTLENEKLDIEIETAKIEKQITIEELQVITEKKLLNDIEIIKIRLEKCNILNEVNEEILRKTSDQILFHHNTDVAEELLSNLRIIADDCNPLPMLDAGYVGRLGMLWTLLLMSIPATISLYWQKIKKKNKL